MSSDCLPEVKSDRKFLNCQPKKWSWSLFTDLVNTKLKQSIVFLACSDWLLKLRICSAIHLQAKPNSCKLPEKWNTVCCHNKQRNFTNIMKLLLKNMKKVTKIALAVFTGSFVCLTWIYQWKQWKSYLFTNVNYIPANSHALGVSFTPAGWKLRSHAGSRLRANFSRLIEKCELLPSCLTQFSKIC